MGLNHAPVLSRHVKVQRASFSGVLAGWWRIVFQPVAMLAVPLTVAVYRLKKPFIYAGFDNLNTDGTRMRETPSFVFEKSVFHPCFICG